MKKPQDMLISYMAAMCLFFALGPGGLAQAEPRAEDYSVFKQLFEKKIAAAQRTRETDDDIELLGEMEASAASIPDSPEVQRLIYRAMVDLATSSRQYLSAVSAIDLLKAQFPDDPAADDAQALSLLEKGYRSSRRDERKAVGEVYLARLLKKTDSAAESGDLDSAVADYRRARLIARDINSPAFPAIQNAIDRVDRRIRTETKIQELKATLKQDPANAAIAQELTRLLMIEQDNPAEAVKYVEQSKNTAWIEAVTFAAKEPTTLDSNESLRVAEWYFVQSRGTSYHDDVLHHILTATVSYCDLTLEQYTQRDAKRLRISGMRTKAAEQLAELDAAGENVGATAQWIDLLERFDSKAHNMGNAIGLEDSKLTSDGHDFILAVSPDAGYDLKLGFTFVEGNDGLNFSLPIGKSHFTLSYSRGQHTSIKLKGVDSIEAKRYMLKPGQEVELLIRLRRVGRSSVAVQFLVNDDVVIDWKGNAKQLESNAAFQTPEQFGRSIRVNCGGRFIFTDIQYKEVED